MQRARTVFVGIKMPREWLDQIRRRAAKEERTVSAVLRVWIREKLEEKEKT